MGTSNLGNNFQINRENMLWNERVVSRRRAVAHSDSDSLEVNDPPLPPQPLPPQKCSSCSCRRSQQSLKKHQESTTSVQEGSNDRRTKAFCLQQVETKLYNAELEEAMHAERLEKTQEQLHRAAQLLEAQLLYAQSVDLRARAVARLTQLTGNFVYKDLTPSDSLAQTLDKAVCWDGSLQEQLGEVQAAAAREPQERLFQLLEEFREKRKDYQNTSSNFSQYLRSASRVSSSQLRHFESRYDSIRGSYEQSRQLLESELPKLIDERYDVLQQCFSRLVPVHEKTIEQDKRFLQLLKEVSKSLQESSKGQPCRHACDDKYTQPKHKNMYDQS